MAALYQPSEIFKKIQKIILWWLVAIYFYFSFNKFKINISEKIFKRAGPYQADFLVSMGNGDSGLQVIFGN